MSEIASQTRNQAKPGTPLLSSGLLQRQCACGSHTSGGGTCSECSEKDHHLQRKVMSTPSSPSTSHTPPRIQRFTGRSSGEAGTAPASVGRVLARPGAPLEPGLPQDMESRFGYDFSNVRVHSDVARAYAVRHRVDSAAVKIPRFGRDSRGRLGYGEASKAVQSSGIGGLKPGVEPQDEHELIGGRTVGEFLGDVGRPVGTFFGNVFGSLVGALTGISISSKTNVGPTWTNHGQFNWQAGFSTTGRSGWIVQEIVNNYRAQDTAGHSVVPPHTPHYWEAWSVDAAGNVTPNVGPDNDYWRRPSRGNNTEGHWSMKGSVYFTKTNPTTQGFAVGNAPDAGILLSTTSAPAGLGVARLHRYAQGHWDSTGVVPTHTGSAGP